MGEKKKCQEHSWKAMYYREKTKGESFQRWVKIEGLQICGECKQIRKVKTEELIKDLRRVG